jgi:hypothetical protein
VPSAPVVFAVMSTNTLPSQHLTNLTCHISQSGSGQRKRERGRDAYQSIAVRVARGRERAQTDLGIDERDLSYSNGFGVCIGRGRCRSGHSPLQTVEKAVNGEVLRQTCADVDVAIGQIRLQRHRSIRKDARMRVGLFNEVRDDCTRLLAVATRPLARADQIDQISQ